MKRVAVFLVIAAACTAPDYVFPAATDAGGPDLQGRDSGPPSGDDDDDVVAPPEDAAADAFRSSDAAPLAATAMPNTGDINADCTSFVVADMGAAVLQGVDLAKHCVMFFHSATYKRTWDEGRTMCGSLTRGAKQGRLAVFPDEQKGDALIAVTNVFPATLAAWIGLELTADPPTSKTSWQWVTGESAQAFDGWTVNHPAGPGRTCVSWAGSGSGEAQWTDIDCGTLKGVVCEMDE